MKTLKHLITLLILIFGIQAIDAQDCMSINDFESESIGPLPSSVQFGGYFAAQGSPIYTGEENCTPGGSQAIQIKASVDGSDGDVVGQTMSFGIVPPPTYFGGRDYLIQGSKLLSNFSTGDYEELNMTIALSNGNSGGVVVVSKALDLQAGVCAPWPPSTFTSPDDFDNLLISFSATSPSGGDELFFVIDDWCIEEVIEDECIAEIEVEQVDNCGEYKFHAIGSPNASNFDWVITPIGGAPITATGNPACIDFTIATSYSVMLTQTCDDGSIGEVTLNLDVDFDTDPPVFEDCVSSILVPTEIIEGECQGTFEIPTLQVTDESMLVTDECYLDGVLINPGTIVTRSPGSYSLFCLAIDECGNESSCTTVFEIEPCGMPCDYQCCEGDPNWPVEDLPLGSLAIMPDGYFAEFGDAKVIEDGCQGSLQSIELLGAGFLPGDGVSIRTSVGSGFIFEAGNSYCISYCVKSVGLGTPSPVLDLHATSDSQTDATCSGNCEIIGQSDIVLPSQGWIEQQIIYTPTANQERLLLINNNNGVIDGPTALRIDNVCITANPNPIECKAEIIVTETDVCGKVIVDIETCGEIEELVIKYDNGGGLEEVNDTTVCIEYPSIGPWTVTVDYVCADGTVRSETETFSLSSNPIIPMISCPQDTTIIVTSEEDCIAQYLLGAYTVSDPSASVNCYVSGILVTDPTMPISIPEGIAQIQYVASNECGSDTCTYEVTVDCDSDDSKYDCPIDVVFVMDNSGSIQDNEYQSMQNSALQEIAAISGVYTNAKFGVLHYSGSCGENISIEHDFSPSSSITAINRQFRNVFPGFNDNLDAALEAMISAMYGGATDPDILAGTLTPTPGADLYVVVFTDGFPFVEVSPGCANSQLQPYTQANILKNTYNANISVVHFVPGIADAECAAISSIGGNYIGTVDANPGDPTNPSGPRQYIPAPFGTPDIDLLEILPACAPCFDCDSLVVIDKVVDEGACCYSIDIDNNIGSDIKKIEAQVINSDWQFNTTTTNPGLGFQYVPGSTPTANTVCITSSTGSIPMGTSADVLEYCFSPTVASPNPSQTVVIRWYSQTGDLYELECTDTLVTSCEGVVDDPCLTGEVVEIACNPDNAYEYEMMVTITNNSGQAATHASFSGLPSGYQFAQAGSSTGSSIINVVIPGGLADGATATVPLKIISPLPILSPQNVCFDLGLFSFMGECCHAPEQVCVVLDPCCDPCEDITTTARSITVPDQDQCCFAFDVAYDCDYLYFNKIKFTSTTIGVDFGYHAIDGSRFNMCGSTNKELCIEPVTTPLVRGSYTAALTVCMDGVSDPSQVPQLIKVDYHTSNVITNEDTVACSEVLELDCEPVNNECLEVTNQELICIPDSMKYRYTFQIKNTSSIPFSATSMTAFVIAPADIQFTAPGSTFPFAPSLAPGDSATITACLESTSTFPTAASDLILGYRLAHMAGDTCCYESILDTIPFPLCDESICCSDEEGFNSLISLGFQVTDLGDCTYEVCANQFDTCHYFGTLGPDWGDGSVTLPAINQSNPPSNCWTHTYTTPGPHNVCMTIYEGDPSNNDDCWNANMCTVLEHDCPAVVDTACFSVIDIDAKNVVCDTTSCYDDPLCLPWLVSHLNSISCGGLGFLHADKAIYNGSPVFVVTSGYLDSSKDDVFDCAGNLLQSCTFSVPGSGGGCLPDAGIDLTSDLSSVVRIYTCGIDPIPVYDPALCSSGTDMSVDYCVEIMNNQSVGIANQIDLQGLMPIGLVVTPSTVTTNIAAGSRATINFNVSGPLVAGWNIKLKGIMRGLDDNENPTMCMDTICLPVPVCPMDECCVDEDLFDANVLQGFQVTPLGNCAYEVCANQFDTCHYFGTLGPDWGDGSVTIPAITQSNPPSNCWTYTYATSGTYTISLAVFEGGSPDEVCWSGELETTVEADCCTQDPCESVDLMSTSVSTSVDSCCTLFSMDNGFCDDYFTGFVIDVAAPTAISQISTLNGFVLNQISPTKAHVVRQGGGFVPLGTLDVFQLCTIDYASSAHSVTVSWLVPVPGSDPDEVCSEDFEIECDTDVEPKCYEIVEDSIDCESMTYCIKIKNISQPGFDINSVHLYDFFGGTLSPAGRITIPTLTPGSTSDWICYQYSGAAPGDNVCYKLSAHNMPAHLPPTQCCTEILTPCFEVPSCPMTSCGTCPDGSTSGPNLIVNGDFEDPINPYVGWTSPYTIVPVGPMNTQDVSVRNSTNLANAQWAATDHTNGATVGNFLAVDGPWRNQVAYSTQVSVVPNTDYVFCMWVDNLVRTSIASTPLLRIDIGGATVEAGYPLPKTPDGWQLLTYNYNSGSMSGAISIDVIDQDLISYSDWAIDDVSFAQCGIVVVDDCCDDLDEQAICDYYDALNEYGILSAHLSEDAVTI